MSEDEALCVFGPVMGWNGSKPKYLHTQEQTSVYLTRNYISTEDSIDYAVITMGTGNCLQFNHYIVSLSNL